MDWLFGLLIGATLELFTHKMKTVVSTQWGVALVSLLQGVQSPCQTCLPPDW